MTWLEGISPRTVAEAMTVLRQELQADDHYAWTWHCNIAAPLMDEGVSWMQANMAAARFMATAFDVDTESRLRVHAAEIESYLDALAKPIEPPSDIRRMEL